MAELVRVRGLSRRVVRLGTKSINNKATSVVDLDDPVTRRDVGHHSTLGALVIFGTVVAAVSSGAVVSNGTTTTFSVTAGTLLRSDDGTTVAIPAGTNTALGTAPNVTNPRLDLVVADVVTGAVSQVAGTAAVAPQQPAVPSGKIPLATLRVAANAAAPADVVVTNITNHRL